MDIFSSIIRGRQLQKNAHRDVFLSQPVSRFPAVTVELLILLASLFFTLFCNRLFWSAIADGRDWGQVRSWIFVTAVFAILTAVHCFLLGLLVGRRTIKPVLSILFMLTAGVMYYMDRYTVFFDAGMMRNILHTDLKEARELLSLNLLQSLLLYGVLPGLFLSLIPIYSRPWSRAILMRLIFLLGSLAVAAGGTFLVFQEMSALIRNQKEVRYLATPGNYLLSLVRVLVSDTKSAHAFRLPLGIDARLAPVWKIRSKPVVFVIVVGETARAANWGLNGYARQTTPQLAAAEVLNFPHVTSCGTNTEISVPCMFSSYGRSQYDETSIRQHESVLHLLARTGFKIIWRDNQSGCKGVCNGLELQQIDNSRHPTLCDAERCLDEILLDNLNATIRQTQGNLILVLHQLGNHGPAYFHRYPPAFRQFVPTCDTSELGKCSQQEIVNSYDNALLYTDHLLAQTIQLLKRQDTHDTALLYLSDHGESLGEKGIYLHGMPYAIAPKEQTQVPMIMWISNGFAASMGLNLDCLKNQTGRAISHDYLFHSLLGMLQVTTQLYDKSLDIAADCPR